MKKIFILFIMIANISTNGFTKDSYLNRGIGFGASIGNPIINLIMSFPFIDFEIGYGGSNGINLSGPKLESKFYDFNLLAIAALDFIFTISLIKNLNLGIGIGGNISISSHTSKLINVELGFGMRIPLVIFLRHYRKFRNRYENSTFNRIHLKYKVSCSTQNLFGHKIKLCWGNIC